MIPNNFRGLEIIFKKIIQEGGRRGYSYSGRKSVQYFVVLLYLFTISFGIYVICPKEGVCYIWFSGCQFSLMPEWLLPWSSACNTDSDRVWNQPICIKLNWKYMSTTVIYSISRLKNLKIFLNLFNYIRSENSY